MSQEVELNADFGEDDGTFSKYHQDPSIDSLESWKQLELRDCDVIDMVQQLGLPFQQVPLEREAMNKVIQQNVDQYIEK